VPPGRVCVREVWFHEGEEGLVDGHIDEEMNAGVCKSTISAWKVQHVKDETGKGMRKQ